MSDNAITTPNAPLDPPPPAFVGLHGEVIWNCERCGEMHGIETPRCFNCGLQRAAHLDPWVPRSALGTIVTRCAEKTVQPNALADARAWSRWPVCCEGEAAFVKSLGAAQISSADNELEKTILCHLIYERGLFAADAVRVLHTMRNGSGPRASLFRCPRCERQHIRIERTRVDDRRRT